MASLRLRRSPALGSVLALPKCGPSLRTRTFSALRSQTTPRQLYVSSLRSSTVPTYASLSRYQQFSTSPTRYETVVKVPQMAESISEGTLSSFSKQVGDYVEQDEEIASIETDKIDVSVNAPEAGTIKELLVSEGDTVTVGQEIAKLEPGEGGGGGDKEAKQEPKEPASEEQPTSSDPEPKKEEPKKEEPKKEEPPPPPPKKEEKPAPPKEEKKSPPPKQEKKPDESKATGIDSPFGKGTRNENRVKMNRMRLRIAERLKQSQNTAASLTTFNEVDMSNIMEFRKKYKDEILKNTGVKLGFMSAFAKASILAMREVPTVNASIEGPGGGDTIVYRDFVDISVAVATPKGLVTPVVRNAESLEMVEIEKAIADLGKKARDGKLTIEDMAGGTYTISNGGVFGSMMGTPIINLPQTAVLGLHAIKERAMVVNGKIEIRPMMYLALTYDHRLLDGREAVTFLVKIKEYIEDPRKMLLA
ncbi:uncharacterized protein Z520_01214 [Fonsecaea multimorphosa CBS 102226]|uniref:dihydrolipoyllysine-residue succinyltransferase n=1 Tax=Fonsecaea multimorphosa CBS 102226 TaxID=1442371 RepID=A0A0D2L134_9EURO|nr:uncharacterized protein Z520_01214 [Fonsecaea multimorphosa CBS 102226]KIY02749.1 hypothetical protein Z520_01214 [Fonsecaea multimorphosa CBS 102226]OAL31172.1 hypothetical protein AYO22_01205 [Fonsecaea multimorphosa]